MHKFKDEIYHLHCISEYSPTVEPRCSYYRLKWATKAIKDKDTIWSFLPMPVHLGDPTESWNMLINAVFVCEFWTQVLYDLKFQSYISLSLDVFSWVNTPYTDQIWILHMTWPHHVRTKRPGTKWLSHSIPSTHPKNVHCWLRHCAKGQRGGCAAKRWVHCNKVDAQWAKKKNNCASNSDADHFGVCSQLGGAKREQRALRDIQYMVHGTQCE